MQDIEAIIKDLYALSPELAVHDAEIRELVADLIANQPRPVPNQAFADQLRRKLLMAAPTPRLTWQTVLWHLLPIGAVAVLVFVLAPSYTTTVPYTVVAPASSTTSEQSSEEVINNPQPKLVADTTPIPVSVLEDEVVEAAADSILAAEATPEAEVSLMRSMPVDGLEVAAIMSEDTVTILEPVSVGSVTIEFQSLLEPSFVVIKSLPTQEIIGVSELLPLGEVGTTTISSKELVANGLYAAVLYRDTNTDQVFTDRLDIAVPNPEENSWTEFVEVQFLVSI